MTTPDEYESAGTNHQISGFPDDESAGKHYMVAVPDYQTRTVVTPGSPDQTVSYSSYFRHGVHHSKASSYDTVTGRWTAPADTTIDETKELGDDLITGIVAPSDFRMEDGGVRDHTDGNRVTTTRNDVFEVIGGQYRRQILNNQLPSHEDDPDWAQSPAGDAEDTSVIEHTYPDLYYDVIATWYLPGTPYTVNNASYTSPRIGEPRKKIEDLRKPHSSSSSSSSSSAPGPEQVVGSKPSDFYYRDIYEYTYGFNIYEVLVGQESIVEKTYGKSIHGVTSGIYKTKPDWEHQIDDDLRGNNRNFTVDATNATDHFDVAELILANRLLEVSRAKTYFEERLLCDDGDFLIVLGANRQTGTFTDKTWGYNVVMDEDATHDITVNAHAGHDITESVDAGNDISETTHAHKNITDTVTAGGAIREITTADAVFGFTGAKGTVTEITATPFVFDMTLALSILEIAVSAINITFEVGKKFEFENFKLTHTVEKHELTELRTQLNTWGLKIENTMLGISMNNLSVGEQNYLVMAANIFI